MLLRCFGCVSVLKLVGPKQSSSPDYSRPEAHCLSHTSHTGRLAKASRLYKCVLKLIRMLVESKTKAEILSVPILQERKGLSDPPGAQTQSIRPAVIYLRTGHENLSIASHGAPQSAFKVHSIRL